MSQYYKILDLPPVPELYVEQALVRAQEFTDLPEEQRLSRRANPLHHPDRPVLQVIRNGQTQSGRTAPRVDFADVMSDWVNTNVSREWNQITVGVNLPPINGDGGDTTVAHTDTTRAYVLIYLLSVSNEDQATVFYQQRGQARHRRRNTTVEDYSQLSELERACYPLHRWVMLDATVIHGVENVLGHRTAIHIGFDIDPFGVMQWEKQ